MLRKFLLVGTVITSAACALNHPSSATIGIDDVVSGDRLDVVSEPADDVVMDAEVGVDRLDAGDVVVMDDGPAIMDDGPALDDGPAQCS